MSIFEEINQANNVATFKAASQSLRDLIHSGSSPETANAALFVLAIRGHSLILRARGRDLKAAHLIANQVMLTLRAEPSKPYPTTEATEEDREYLGHMFADLEGFTS